MTRTNTRTLSAFIEVSVDGYYSDRNDEIAFAHKALDDAEWQGFVAGNAAAGGMLLLGRKTYEMMAAWWPTPPAAQAMPAVAARMNALPKLVCSRTLAAADWHNTSLLTHDLAGTIRRLKGDPGPDMTILGSGTIIAQLADAGLVDVLQMVVNPVALGAGKALFAGLERPLQLRRMSMRVFQNGAVVLWYAPR